MALIRYNLNVCKGSTGSLVNVLRSDFIVVRHASFKNLFRWKKDKNVPEELTQEQLLIKAEEDLLKEIERVSKQL